VNNSNLQFDAFHFDVIEESQPNKTKEWLTHFRVYLDVATHERM